MTRLCVVDIDNYKRKQLIFQTEDSWNEGEVIKFELRKDGYLETDAALLGPKCISALRDWLIEITKEKK